MREELSAQTILTRVDTDQLGMPGVSKKSKQYDHLFSTSEPAKRSECLYTNGVAIAAMEMPKCSPWLQGFKSHLQLPGYTLNPE